MLCFNPRPYMRGDLDEVGELPLATQGFNPRPYMRGDPRMVAVVIASDDCFNPVSSM